MIGIQLRNRLVSVLAPVCLILPFLAQAEPKHYVFEAGHPSLQEFLLPDSAPSPANNVTTKERVALGKKLFFDPRLSAKGNMSCATCHNPSLGWSDGLPTGRGHSGVQLDRATPSIVNAGFNETQMWDGRAPTLEAQATEPMEAEMEMASNFDAIFKLLNNTEGYLDAFAAAYPGEAISKETIGKALAAFERTVVSNDSRFDRWVKGDKSALTQQEIRGFEAFMDPARGKCAECHEGANFTDSSFHDLGLASSLTDDADQGRFAEKPLEVLKHAFKTPSVREVSRTAPYFHDGSARTLQEVVAHYVKGPLPGTSASPTFTKSVLTAEEQDDIVAFMHALSSEQTLVVTVPALPQ